MCFFHLCLPALSSQGSLSREETDLPQLRILWTQKNRKPRVPVGIHHTSMYMILQLTKACRSLRGSSLHPPAAIRTLQGFACGNDTVNARSPKRTTSCSAEILPFDVPSPSGKRTRRVGEYLSHRGDQHDLRHR